MIPFLSLVTSVKDYLEVVHKLIEYDSGNASAINYSELGTILTYIILLLKNFVIDFISLTWLKNIWSIPIILPDISKAMISEISVFDGLLHNALNFLEQPMALPDALREYGDQNIYYVALGKFTIGLLNSLFLCLPTSIVFIITLRFFVMQGLEAGFISGLGAIAGNILWIASVILGWRFIVIPWLSMDILRYILGFILLVKYMWESYNEKKQIRTKTATREGSIKIFLLSFLLSLTEQTSIYPFISNFTISPEVSIFESFNVETIVTNSITQYLFIHFAYLLGLLIGSISLLYFTCWFLENPAFKLYMWLITNQKNKPIDSSAMGLGVTLTLSTNLYYKILNFIFLYLTMFSALASIPYYGLDYTITNPIGYVNDDRIIQDKTVLETSFLGSKPSDGNTRRNRGRHGRRERWKRRIRKYRTFDASLYDQGLYDLFTIEDLNYGFDRFWLRRKLRNHRVRFRFFPGPWMRTFKKQLAKPRLESYTGPRIIFFRILFEQVYHPSFHAYASVEKQSSYKNGPPTGEPKKSVKTFNSMLALKAPVTPFRGLAHSPEGSPMGKQWSLLKNCYHEMPPSRMAVMNLRYENSTLRKFVRKFDTRLKTAEMLYKYNFPNKRNSQETSPPSITYLWNTLNPITIFRDNKNFIPYSKQNFKNSQKNTKFTKIRRLRDPLVLGGGAGLPFSRRPSKGASDIAVGSLSKKDYNILRYKSLIKNLNRKNQKTIMFTGPLGKSMNVSILHPLKFYLQKQKAFEKKLHYYTPNIYRQFTIENNAPYFRVMMKRYFYNYKPTNRWERTMKIASLRKARRKTTRRPKRYVPPIGHATNIKPLSRMAVIDDGDRNKYEGLQQLHETLSTSSNQQSLMYTVPLGENTIPKGGTLRASIRKNVDELIIKRGISSQNYSVVNKRANRYRYQIYKDVLQHWYYSPFNRVLMKWDVDSFIKRQPNAHFLTAKEENLLHLRRFLLSEHYNTLRWYTNMEHYRTMKTKINGIKSFSSNSYNQQFVGTFKKIRHLFAITPSQKNTVLKFDQPLYNEYKNLKGSLWQNLFMHEETLPLLNDAKDVLEHHKGQTPPPVEATIQAKQGSGANAHYGLWSNDTKYNLSFYDREQKDILSKSQIVLQDYLIQTRPIREEYIKQLLNEKNYIKLTQFLFKGQKIRGNMPVTNQRKFNKQENDILLTKNEKEQIYKMATRRPLSLRETPRSATVRLPLWVAQQYHSPLGGPTGTPVLRTFPFQLGGVGGLSHTPQGSLPEGGHESTSANGLGLNITYLKKWNDQESLKNYLAGRIEKREKRKQQKEKHLLDKILFINQYSGAIATKATAIKNSPPADGRKGETMTSSPSMLLTSGLQKSIFEGLLNTYKNFPKIYSENSNIISKNSINMTVPKGSITQPLVSAAYSSSVTPYFYYLREKSMWKFLLLKNKNFENLNIDSGDVTTFSTMSLRGAPQKGECGLDFTVCKIAQKFKVLKQIKTTTIIYKKIIDRTPSRVLSLFDGKTPYGIPVGQGGYKPYRLSNMAPSHFFSFLFTVVPPKGGTTILKRSLREALSVARCEGGTLCLASPQRGDPFTRSLVGGAVRRRPTDTPSGNFASAKARPSDTPPKGGASNAMPVMHVTKLLVKTAKSLKNILIHKFIEKNLYHITKLKPFKSFIKPMKRKSLKNWRKKERAIEKQKRLRKDFKLLTTKKIKKSIINGQSPIIQNGPPTGGNLLGPINANMINVTSRKKLDSVSEQQIDINKYKILKFYENSQSQRDTVQQIPSKGGILPEAFQASRVTNGTNNNVLTGPVNNPYGAKAPQESLVVAFNRVNEILFKRKIAPQRRSRTRRNRGVFKKRILNNQKKAIESFLNNQKSLHMSPLRGNPGSPAGGADPLQGPVRKNILGRPMGWPLFEKNLLKQRKSKRSLARLHWKQKRSKFSQKRRKYRKRRRYAIGKIRVLSKQLKRVKNKLEIRNSYMWLLKQNRLAAMPSIQASTDALWQIEKDQLIHKKLSEFTPTEILYKNHIYDANTVNGNPILQIGKTDFKPLALPESLKQILTISENSNYIGGRPFCQKDSSLQQGLEPISKKLHCRPLEQNKVDINATADLKIHKLYDNIFANAKNRLAVPPSNHYGLRPSNHQNKIFITPSTTIPFYAGWDESLRKFIVTNRMLSRIDAGYEFKTGLLPSFSIQPIILARKGSTERYSKKSAPETLSLYENAKEPFGHIEYTQAPLQGMNAATTLYWQIPFTTYDPDQFFALGMDGFSPIGWRKFVFRHSILKSWLNNIIYKNHYGLRPPVGPEQAKAKTLDFYLEGRYGLQPDILPLSTNGESTKGLLYQSQKITKGLSQSTREGGLLAMQVYYLPKIYTNFKKSALNIYPKSYNVALPPKWGVGGHDLQPKQSSSISRRLKKRYRRVKKHPRTPVWFPSGTLLNQVLPVHYIYVFYKRSRLPRDRYLKRRIAIAKQNGPISTLSNLENQKITNATNITSNVLGRENEIFDMNKRSRDFLGFDFTLRKRLKPKRKYHLKRDRYSDTTNVIIPQRFKFIDKQIYPRPYAIPEGQNNIGSVITSDTKNKLRIRPLSMNFGIAKKLKKPIAEIVKEQKYMRLKQSYASKKTPMLRVKQLRRRVQRQILRSVWRYRPRAGGFLWPGDYLKFELIKAPKLVSTKALDKSKGQNALRELDTPRELHGNVSDIKRKTKSTARKKKRTLVEWQIQPKKYLYEKHNINVLKKKLKKAQKL